MAVKRISITIMALFFALCLGTAGAGPYYQTGTLVNHTAIVGGLLISFNTSTPLPDNCAAAAGSWMFIPEANKTMIAAALLAIAMNNRDSMTVYTSGMGANGFCTVTQVDPAN